MLTEHIIVDSRASAVLFRFLNSKEIRKKILVPVNICSIVPAVIQNAGFETEYIDINSKDLCADEELILEKLLKNPNQYSGIIYNYTYGLITDKDNFFKSLKSKFDLWIIEDKCSCFPDLSCSDSVDMTLFSTGYAKQVDLGFGGYGIFNTILTESDTQKTTFEVNPDKTYVVNVNDFQLTLTEYFNKIQIIGDKTSKHKKKLNDIYKKLLPHQIQLGSEYNDWRFNILVENKDVIIDAIFQNDLFASNHFRCLSNEKDLFRNASYLHKKIINLFNDLYFNEEQVFRICEIINRNL